MDVLSTKAEANYGAGFRRKVFGSDVARASVCYGRHFEAWNQLEAHPYEDVVAVGLLPGIDADRRAAIEANPNRLDVPGRRFASPMAGE